ncbi:SPOR domain-containing protein [Arenimonas sp.]|uniref:SPOR domain-containing protein n=1 Tax=Arenimonas sp. TaxID=1872635 RepID=UPI0035AED8A7
MARRSKNQAKRNGSQGTPGWVWLLGGLVLGAVIVVVLLVRNGGDVGQLVPKPDPEARAPVATDEPVAQDAPEPRKPKYDFYDVLRDKEVVIPDAELAAQARAEAESPPATEPAPAADGARFLIQAGAFRSSSDAEALKARIALTGEVARVEPAQIEGGTIYRVRLGPYPNAASLAAAKGALGNHGIEALAIRAE